MARTHIVDVAEPRCSLHAHAVTAFLNLRRAAAADGFDLAAQSSYRDFARQLAIWNAKWTGAARLNDAAGRPQNALDLPPAERVAAILVWSALPGASRHHWGTDVDLIDRNAVAAGYQVELSAAEFAPHGPFAPLGAWLEINAPRFGFFRPFRGVKSGVAAEPWHFSFAPVAEFARRDLTVDVLARSLEHAPLLGVEQVLERLSELHARYVASIDWP
jgi:LAS superfamily LD-carboxypeptidase LdcB